MKKLTVVIVFGGYGSGKTRLVSRLADALGSGVRAAALVQQTGPVNLDPLWYSGLPVVAMEKGCACDGGGEILDCLRLLRERDYSVVLVELAGDQEAEPYARAVAEGDGAEVILVEAESVGDGGDVGELVGRIVEELEEGPGEGEGEGPGEGEGDEHEHGHEHVEGCGEACGCGDGHGHEHGGGGCTCDERRGDPQWMPFGFAEGGDEEVLMEALGRLPEAVIRVKGVVRLGEGRWLRVDRASGVVNRQTLMAADLPELYDVESLALGDALEAVPPNGGGLLVLWTRAASEADSVVLEWEVSRILADCLGVEGEPAEVAAFAVDSLESEELIFEALTAARVAAVAEPQVADHVELLAKCYHELGEVERAMVLLREAARIEPHHLSSRLNSARLHLAYKETDRARTLAEAVVADYPQDADVHAVLGEALLEQGELNQAAEHLEAAAKGLPDDDVLLSMLCNLFAELGEYQRALSYNSEVLSLDPADDGAMYLRGELLLRLDRAEDAVDSLDQALAAGNESPWVMTALGIAQLRCGNEEEASGCFGDAFVLASEQLEQMGDDSSVVDVLLAASFRGRIDQVPEVWARLGGLERRELEKALDTLSLAPERGEAQRTLDAIAQILATTTTDG